jgi:outer membrane protein insertion porin family
MSLGYNLWWREFDYSDFGVAQYSSNSGAAQAVVGLPITEYDTVSALVGIDSNEILVDRFGSTPGEIVDYVDAVGNQTFHSWRAQLGFGRDTRNNAIFPSAGTSQRITLETTLPGSTVEYFKVEYDFSKFWPIGQSLVLNTRLDLGYGDSYGQDFTRTVPDGRIVTASGLPFFENFYAGGVSSQGRLRGYSDNTLGPRAASRFGFPQPIGGSLKTIGSLEMYFPKLFDSNAARISAFVDFGNVYRDVDDFDAGELRASTGISLLWRSPMGPISISYAIPLRSKDADPLTGFPGDETERLQFTFSGGL